MDLWVKRLHFVSIVARSQSVPFAPGGLSPSSLLWDRPTPAGALSPQAGLSSACNAKASRQGIPIKSFGLNPPPALSPPRPRSAVRGLLRSHLIFRPMLPRTRRVAVPHVHPAGPILAQHPPDLPEHRHHSTKVKFRSDLQPHLAGNPIIPQPEVRGRSHHAMHRLRRKSPQHRQRIAQEHAALFPDPMRNRWSRGGGNSAQASTPQLTTVAALRPCLP